MTDPKEPEADEPEPAENYPDGVPHDDGSTFSDGAGYDQ